MAFDVRRIKSRDMFGEVLRLGSLVNVVVLNAVLDVEELELVSTVLCTAVCTPKARKPCLVLYVRHRLSHIRTRSERIKSLKPNFHGASGIG